MANERVQSDGFSPPAPHSRPLRLFAGGKIVLLTQERCHQPTAKRGAQLLEEDNASGRRSKLHLEDTESCNSGVSAGALPYASSHTSYKEVSTLLFSLGEEKGLETHFKGPFFPSSSKHTLQIQLSEHPCHKPAPTLVATLFSIPGLRCLQPVFFLGQGTHLAQIPPSSPPCRTWPILSKVSNKSRQLRHGISRVKSKFLQSTFLLFSHTTVFHCPGCAAGGMGSYLSLQRVLNLGMLLPLADSSLLNSAHLLIKIKKSLDSGLVTEGTGHLCTRAEPETRRLGGWKPLRTPREGNDGCREKSDPLLGRNQGVFQVFLPCGSHRRGLQRGDSWHTNPRGQKLQEESSSCLCNSLSCCFPGQDRTGQKTLPESERSCGGWRIPSALHLLWRIQTGVSLAGSGKGCSGSDRGFIRTRSKKAQL